MRPGGPRIRVSVGKMQPAKPVSPVGPPAGAAQERVGGACERHGLLPGEGQWEWEWCWELCGNQREERLVGTSECSYRASEPHVLC